MVLKIIKRGIIVITRKDLQHATVARIVFCFEIVDEEFPNGKQTPKLNRHV